MDYIFKTYYQKREVIAKVSSNSKERAERLLKNMLERTTEYEYVGSAPEQLPKLPNLGSNAVELKEKYRTNQK